MSVHLGDWHVLGRLGVSECFQVPSMQREQNVFWGHVCLESCVGWGFDVL